MRTTIAAGAATLIFSMAPAQADVSGDLVFCSKLSSPRERIACYDAAARIAANHTHPAQATPRARAAVITRDVADHPTPTSNFTLPPTSNPFQGAYVALGGSFGLSGPRTTNLSSLFNFMTEAAHANGWSGAGAAGYNITVGRFLFGIELDGRWGDERGSVSKTATQPTPNFFNLFGSDTLSYEIKSDAGVHLSARIGATFENTLIFAKFGLGATHIVETLSRDGRGLLQCVPGPFFTCIGVVSAGMPLVAQSHSKWLPSGLFGLGIEQNFGSFFIRGQGELEVAPLQRTGFAFGTVDSNLFWTVRATLALGMRF